MNSGRFQHGSDFRSAAVDHYWTHAGAAKEYNVLQDFIFEIVVEHSIAAVFYDHCFPFESA